ncbi:MAG: ATP-binding protein [Zoogloea sp.]|uniref:hemerythrin domain-containing protein n=1 Tax=Zoogloea sp. TaxID=49181 RepID=UPI00262E9510|nr:hemerythrin domain-containing protein [Zoogloea sp.]MDD3327406.1 ATP-binding protein [Zoogloea sp.]
MSAPAISPFVWAEYFETGFDDVDGQHHKLVDFINALAGRAISGTPIRPDELAHSLDGLSRYAAHHFATEEALMERAGLDPRHIGPHRKAHADFVAQVEAMRLTSDPTAVLPGLYNFVTSWLSFHILDTDQSMARQLRAVADGLVPEQAFAADQAQGRDPGSTALIAAVRSLLGLVADRNKELQNINSSLEARVAERTAALTAANRDLLATQQRLREADRLAVVGQLAAGVAHEINNPLGFITANLRTLHQYAKRLLALTEEAGRLAEAGGQGGAWQALRGDADIDYLAADLPGLFDECTGGLQRVGEIVQVLQGLASPGPLALAPVPMAPLLDAAVAATACSRQPGQVLQRDYAALPVVPANAALLGSALEALLHNAAQALDGAAGRIVLRAREHGDELVIEIEDNGCGMDEATRARIFEPFFTTRPVGQGRGLGLSSALRIVASHGGRIAVRSVPGRGSCFRICLPLDRTDRSD